MDHHRVRCLIFSFGLTEPCFTALRSKIGICYRASGLEEHNIEIRTKKNGVRPINDVRF